MDAGNGAGPSRSRYFTVETIRAASARMLADLESTARGRLRLRPERSALLIVDMQAAFLDATSHAFVPSAEAILPGLAELQSAFADRGLPVICTRHGNREQDAGMMATWWGRRIEAGSSATHLAEALAENCRRVLEKTQYDAFHRTSLHADLSRLGVEQIVLTGVMTHLCCDTTARSAFVHGYEVFLPVDGTATYNEELHRASLLGLSHGVAQLVLVADLLRRMEAV
ncbi:MAG: cysteine hydrolase [Candidatus Bipolaricaulota bacterium]|nr:MAG: cysteine hydrolase [Candidatus Bipolaricaulota bacterium]